ncbi:MAG: Gfo/Idh/MocA family protein [Halobacteriota archaeon]
MKVGVIGVGVMGKNHLRVYSEMRGVREIYAFDADEKATQQIRDPEVVVSPSLDSLLDDVDVVSVCVPTAYHYDVAVRVADAGVHCLIEKPMTLTVSEGGQLATRLQNADVIVGVGFVERFNPIIGEIVGMADSPHFIEFKRHNPASSRVADSTVAQDLMIHDIDILFNVLLKKQSYQLYCVGDTNVCKALVKTNGTYAELSASRKACKKVRSIYIELEDCTIEGDFMSQEVYTYRKGGRFGLEGGRYSQENIIEKVLVNKNEPLKEELRTFLDCVRKQVPFPVNPEEALRNQQICEDIGREIT